MEGIYSAQFWDEYTRIATGTYQLSHNGILCNRSCHYWEGIIIRTEYFYFIWLSSNFFLHKIETITISLIRHKHFCRLWIRWIGESFKMRYRFIKRTTFFWYVDIFGEPIQTNYWKSFIDLCIIVFYQFFLSIKPFLAHIIKDLKIKPGTAWKRLKKEEENHEINCSS